MVNVELEETYRLGELHDYPMFMKICCDTLNSEWKRSETARMHSLQKSSSAFPVSLVMFAAKSKEFFGHARVCRILERTDACFIESVIVMSEKRGRGLGRRLMALVEEYARQHGFLTIYLTTKDKQSFYEHLGYTYCEPMTASNSSCVTLETIDRIQGLPAAPATVFALSGTDGALPPPPSPPPPPPPQWVKGKRIDRNWMMKILR
ncbi:N-alpha-acetyltransferase 80 [Galendromus occidentalis]|uniref:N-alpha-acetyltransferase 80 n=1 Tax=Galendromus occidentalis TaxID=34638 RepID=A0AAJ6QXT5_9ACAR|nr:N-alpha-acetyltransferase 80 [Galendromus occidentalis]